MPRRKPNVARLKRRGDLEGLREALRYREPFVDDDGTEWDLAVDTRVEAADALSNFNGPAVAGDLAEALDDPELAVRRAAVEGISRLGMPAGLDPLLDCVTTRAEGTEALSTRAAEVVASWRVEGAAESLAARLVEPGAPELDERHRGALDLLLEADPRGDEARALAADRVIAALGSPNGDHAADRAEVVLGWLGSSVAGRVLSALGDENDNPALVRAAGLLGDSRAVDSIVRGLRSGDPQMRHSAAIAAKTLNHTGAVPALLGATQDPDQSVRDAASAALDRMGTAAVLAGLAALMHIDGQSLTAVDAELSPLTASAPGGLDEGDAPAASEMLPAAVEAVAGAREGDETRAGSGPPQRPAVKPILPVRLDRSAIGRDAAPPRRRGGLVERLLGRLE